MVNYSKRTCLGLDFHRGGRVRHVLANGEVGRVVGDAAQNQANTPLSDFLVVESGRQRQLETDLVQYLEDKHGAWTYRDIPGFCKAANLDEIKKHDFVLTPGRYVGAEEQEEDGEPFAEKYPRMVAELEARFAEGERLTAVVREMLGRLHDGT